MKTCGSRNFILRINSALKQSRRVIIKLTEEMTNAKFRIDREIKKENYDEIIVIFKDGDSVTYKP